MIIIAINDMLLIWCKLITQRRNIEYVRKIKETKMLESQEYSNFHEPLSQGWIDRR